MTYFEIKYFKIYETWACKMVYLHHVQYIC